VRLAAPAAPVFGKTTTLEPVSGVVRVMAPGAGDFAPLTAATTFPLGTTIDTTAGRVKMTSARDSGGQPQTGLFDSGIFRVAQTTGRSPLHPGQTVGLSVLTLAGDLPDCTAGARSRAAAASARRPRSRRLWGNAKGNYRTVGQYGSATIRGTHWLTQDTCAGTLVRVAEGIVSVEDRARHRIRLIRAPHSLLVRPPRGGGGGAKPTIRAFTTGVEGRLAELARGRTNLGRALAGASDCSLSAHAARVQVEAVIANRSTIRDALYGLRAPAGQATTVVARLRAALGHSIAADRHYRDWLAALERSHARCPLPRNADYAAAGRENARSTAAKRRFVAALNPLARRQHLRTWRANEF
jgi:hypothetical protein